MHSVFGLKHLLILAACAAAIVGGYFFVRKQSLSAVFKKMLLVGIVSELIKVFYYTVANEATHGGILPKTDLPFHLCSIQILFILVINISSNEKIKRFLYSFMIPSCLLGGIAALLLATSSSLNGMWILSVQYFGYHVAIIVLALKLMTSQEFSPVIGDYFNCLKFLLVLMFGAMYINSILYDGVSNINFMYVASPPMSGLPFLNEDHGWLVYIAHYGCLVLFCVSACYAKVIFKALTKKKEEQPA